MPKGKGQPEKRVREQSRSSSLPRLEDVARLANVSTATVSRCVNSPQAVSESLRERIEAAIRQLNWVPHSSARALATNRTLTVGAIVPTLANEDFAKAIETLQAALEESGYTLFVACPQYDLEREFRQARKMIERGVDAMVLVGETHLPELYSLFETQGTRFVNSFTYRQSSPYNCIGVDNYQAMSLLVRHLNGLGHTQFGMLVQSLEDNDRALARYNGTMDALASIGWTMKPEHVIQGKINGVKEGRALFRRLLDTSTMPTALVCANGSFAVGAMLEAASAGIDVPNDLSIVSFDDFEIMSQMKTGITCIKVPAAEIGTRVAKTLLAHFKQEPNPDDGKCEPELIVRSSSGPAPRTEQ